VRSAGAVAQVKAEMTPVGAPVVQAIFGIGAAEQRQAILFALSGFTPPALEFAHQAGVALFRFDLQGQPEPASDAALGLWDLSGDADRSPPQHADTSRSNGLIESLLAASEALVPRPELTVVVGNLKYVVTIHIELGVHTCFVELLEDARTAAATRPSSRSSVRWADLGDHSWAARNLAGPRQVAEALVEGWPDLARAVELWFGDVQESVWESVTTGPRLSAGAHDALVEEITRSTAAGGRYQHTFTEAEGKLLFTATQTSAGLDLSVMTARFPAWRREFDVRWQRAGPGAPEWRSGGYVDEIQAVAYLLLGFPFLGRTLLASVG
jgi:hypothetical protein